MLENDRSPSVNKTAFDCPHCGAFAEQYWYDLYARKVASDDKLPRFINRDVVIELYKDGELKEEHYNKLIKLSDKTDSAKVFFEVQDRYSSLNIAVDNMNISECFNCGEISIWKHQSLVSPISKVGVNPNADLPDDIQRDFNEARSIVDISPRGAAALLRLCIQKLCIHLGEDNGTIDKDIAALVSRGLNPIVQKSLDAVRVIGNESVHPGQMNVSEDKETAIQLFILVNFVAEQMISLPKEVERIYQSIPETKRKAIERRDAK
ncbi:DUF4145 domain-containing protein [Aeromonas media]|uniref:DUF4145 domain-containing protein n=1 Tax=Aeromonas media TaxID=651 RepID=UPI00384B9E0F